MPKQFLEGSQAIAAVIKNISPAVVSAYPITPQTHIVEKLAKLKADGEANYEYVRAESEFAAASIILGASATGVRAYSATSSQGLLLMTEVLFNIAGMRLPQYCAVNGLGCDEQHLDRIFEQTRDAAYHIIERKGATYYAIASGLVRICEAIIRDQSTVLSVSSYIKDYYGISDVCLSIPSIVDLGGVERVIHLDLSADEIEGLRKSADILKGILSQLNFD